MECPFCTASLPEEDLFCEACGKPLTTPQPLAALLTGCVCGAAPEEIDEDGYCGRCGHLARRPASDHVEIVVSPDFAGVSDRGIKHQRNEDRFAIRRVDTSYVLVVCDGVSSSAQSEMASSSVAENVANSLEASLRRHSASSPERTVRAAIEKAQSALVTEAGEAAQPDSPSTTVVAALVNGLNATLGWVGDSRAYWIAEDGATRQLTVDHSWMNDVVDSGEMTPEEAAHSPKAHGITHWLGADAGENAQAGVVKFTLPGPGHLLLCTDGLWNYAEDPAHLGSLLQDGAAPDFPALDVARHLIDFANEQGGHDNITAILLRIPAATDSEPADSEPVTAENG
jgi:serine/threonine protein phosphatase PrpC